MSKYEKVTVICNEPHDIIRGVCAFCEHDAALRVSGDALELLSLLRDMLCGNDADCEMLLEMINGFIRRASLLMSISKLQLEVSQEHGVETPGYLQEKKP